MADLEDFVDSVLLPLQLSLGIWQIMRVTPLWAVMRCTLVSLFSLLYSHVRSCFTCCSFPDTDYNKLNQNFEGLVFKRVISHATTAGDVSKMKKRKDPKKSKKEWKSENCESVTVEYLGKKFELQREEGNKMLVKDGPAYYITDKMWETVLHIKDIAPETVFVKNHKEIWDEVITGDIMEFEEVLDSVILDNRAVIRLDHDYFLPVNLVKSEDKLLKILNLVGLFLHADKRIYWLIPALLSLTSAVMGFITTVRLYASQVIKTPLCRAMQILCDRLPLRGRKWVYFLCNWVDNLQPSNDLQLKTEKRDICPLIAGGAKAHFQSSAHPCNMRALVPQVAKIGERDKKYVLVDNNSLQQACSKVGPFFFKCGDSAYIEWIFDNNKNKCSLKAGVLARGAEKSLRSHDVYFYIVCGDDDFRKEEDIKMLASDRCAIDKLEDGVEYNMSVFSDVYCGEKEIADGINTVSVDVDCNSKEAIKLFKLALYMAEQESGSLKSYEHNAKTVCSVLHRVHQCLRQKWVSTTLQIG